MAMHASSLEEEAEGSRDGEVTCSAVRPPQRIDGHLMETGEKEG